MKAEAVSSPRRFLVFSSCPPVVHSLTPVHFLLFLPTFVHKLLYFPVFPLEKLDRYFFLFVCLKDTISVQSNSFISCYSLKWSYLNDAVCAVKYKSGSYFRGHLSVTVQYVFSMENNKNIENNIGWCY